MMKKIALFLLLALTLTGCDWMNQDVKGYFKEYTETAAAEAFEISSYYVKDSAGFYNVPSDRDFKISFYLRNPQLYYFGDGNGGYNFSLIFNGTDADFIENIISDYTITYYQDQDATEVVTMSFPSDLFYYLETYVNPESSGEDSEASEDSKTRLSDEKDASFTFKMVEPKSGRTFQGMSVQLRANSEPMAVKNLTVLETSEDESKYVLAFNMPDMSGIHKDVNSIEIISGDETGTWTVTPDSSDSSECGLDFEAETEFLHGETNSDISNYNIRTTGSEMDFSGISGSRIVYFTSDKKVSDYSEANPCNFTVTLKDNAGLKTSSTASAFSLQLDNVTTDPEVLTTLTASEDDGYSHFTIIAPQKTEYSKTFTTDSGEVRTITKNADPEKITVYYIVYNAAGKIVKQGSGIGSTDVSLASGSWTIESWAHYSGFIDSATISNVAKATGAVYVNQSYEGDICDGGKYTPYKTLSDAFEQIKNSEFTNVEIAFESNYVLGNNETFSLSSYGYKGKLTLNGQTNYTLGRSGEISVTEENSSSAAVDHFDMIAESDSTMVLKNINVGSIKVENGADFTVYGSSTPGYVTLEKDACIKLSNLTDRVEGSTQIYVTEKPAYGWKLIGAAYSEASSAYEEISEADIYSFELKYPGYFINSEENKNYKCLEGIVRLSGIGVSVPEYEGLKVMLYKNESTEESSKFDASSTLHNGDKIYAVVCLYNSEYGNYIAVGNQKITSIGLYVEGSAIYETTSYDSKTGYTIPAVKVSGSYTLEVHFEYDGLVYSAQTVLNVEAE